MSELFPFLVLDLCCFLVAFLLIRRKLTFFHPAFFYFLFHAYVITIPAWQLLFGAPPLYLGMNDYLPVDVEEYIRAVWMADLALIFFGFGCLGAETAPVRRASRKVTGYLLGRSVAILVVGLCLPVGIYSFITVRSFVGDGPVGLLTSGYIRTIAMWPITCMLLCIFRFGFRWYLVMPTVIYLGIVAFQGYHRFMLVLPAIFLLMIYLHQRGRKWPQRWVWVAAIVFALVFPQMKHVGRAIQADSPEMAIQYIRQALFLDEAEDRKREEFLGPYAASLTLADQYGQAFNGSTYLALITLPIPRYIWPEKPGLADHIGAISTLARPMDQEGRIITYMGEAYLNFRYFGLIIIPFIMGFVLSRWHFILRQGPRRRVDQILYFSVAVSLLQIYRDGLMSLIVFAFLNNMPILFAWLIHRFGRLGRTSISQGANV